MHNDTHDILKQATYFSNQKNQLFHTQAHESIWNSLHLSPLLIKDP